MKRRLGKVEILKLKKILNNGRNEGQGRWKIQQNDGWVGGHERWLKMTYD
jgi:hypothetical protein